MLGQNPEQDAPRGWVNNGGFVAIRGTDRVGKHLTRVVEPAERGDNVVTVRPASLQALQLHGWSGEGQQENGGALAAGRATPSQSGGT